MAIATVSFMDFYPLMHDKLSPHSKRMLKHIQVYAKDQETRFAQHLKRSSEQSDNIHYNHMKKPFEYVIEKMNDINAQSKNVEDKLDDVHQNIKDHENWSKLAVAAIISLGIVVIILVIAGAMLSKHIILRLSECCSVSLYLFVGIASSILLVALFASKYVICKEQNVGASLRFIDQFRAKDIGVTCMDGLIDIIEGCIENGQININVDELAIDGDAIQKLKLRENQIYEDDELNQTQVTSLRQALGFGVAEAIDEHVKFLIRVQVDANEFCQKLQSGYKPLKHDICEHTLPLIGALAFGGLGMVFILLWLFLSSCCLRDALSYHKANRIYRTEVVRLLIESETRNQERSEEVIHYDRGRSNVEVLVHPSNDLHCSYHSFEEICDDLDNEAFTREDLYDEQDNYQNEAVLSNNECESTASSDECIYPIDHDGESDDYSSDAMEDVHNSNQANEMADEKKSQSELERDECGSSRSVISMQMSNENMIEVILPKRID